MATAITEFSKEITMLHLVPYKEFNYLNFISFMTAYKVMPITVWTHENDNISGKYWDIIKKLDNVTFKTVDKVGGITLELEDFVGRLNIIYLAPLTDSFADDVMIKHHNMYKDNGEFESKDMVAITIFEEDFFTKEYITSSENTIAQLIRKILPERTYNA